MKQVPNLVRNGCVAATCALLLSTVPALAQNMAVPCSAFARNSDGGWKVLVPVVFRIEGRLLAPTVGTNFSAGLETYGLKMSDILNRACRA
jgi:hypothetical protein